MSVRLVFLGPLRDVAGAAEREVAGPLDWAGLLAALEPGLAEQVAADGVGASLDRFSANYPTRLGDVVTKWSQLYVGRAGPGVGLQTETLAGRRRTWAHDNQDRGPTAALG